MEDAGRWVRACGVMEEKRDGESAFRVSDRSRATRAGGQWRVDSGVELDQMICWRVEHE